MRVILYSRKVLFFIVILIMSIVTYTKLKIDYESPFIIWKNKWFNSDQIERLQNLRENVNNIVEKEKKNTSEFKYILQWTSAKNVPFVYMGVGQQGFIDRKCPYTNCIVTFNRSYFKDYTKFDVIAFAGPDIIHMHDLPKKRSIHQKYVFASIESADNYPICSNKFNRYFNWTWTYKLDSEVRWGYITIRHKNNNIIGPNKEMKWLKLKDMDPISEELKTQLNTKTKAVAWFVSNCYTRNNREKIVEQLKIELNKYQLELDIYGNCGGLKCSRHDEDKCDELIKKTYYFYLSFENSFSEDYVTEKLLRALQNNAVPIVYGGANYSRFMPDDIYLNAKELGIKELAMKISELINDRDKYFNYFKWKNHYSYYRKCVSVETEPYCLFCKILNDKDMVHRTTVYEDFRKWWTPPNRC